MEYDVSILDWKIIPADIANRPPVRNDIRCLCEINDQFWSCRFLVKERKLSFYFKEAPALNIGDTVELMWSLRLPLATVKVM